MASLGELEHRFAYHPADTPEKKEAHARVRAACLRLAEELNGILPAGRPAALALTKAEEAMHWGNAAIAQDTADRPAA